METELENWAQETLVSEMFADALSDAFEAANAGRDSLRQILDAVGTDDVDETDPAVDGVDGVDGVDVYTDDDPSPRTADQSKDDPMGYDLTPEEEFVELLAVASGRSAAPVEPEPDPGPRVPIPNVSQGAAGAALDYSGDSGQAFTDALSDAVRGRGRGTWLQLNPYSY